MVVALGPLVEIAGLLVALGIIALAVILTEALFAVADTTVAWIPWIGKKASGGVRAIEHRLVSRMSGYATGIQGAISDSWHILANLIEETGDAIWWATKLSAHINWLIKVKYPLDIISILAHEGAAAARAAAKVRTGDIKNYYTQKGISAKQWRDVLLKLTTLGAAIALLRAAQSHAPSLPRVYVPSLPQSLKGIRSRLGKLEHRFGRTAFAAAVATALATLGVSWARKSCAKRNNELLCSTNFDQLESLLGGLVLIVSSVSLLNITRGVQEITDEVVGAVRSFIREASALDDGDAPPNSIFGIEGRGEATALGFGVNPSVQRFGIDG